LPLQEQAKAVAQYVMIVGQQDPNGLHVIR
jgi:hypothetical protein